MKFFINPNFLFMLMSAVFFFFSNLHAQTNGCNNFNCHVTPNGGASPNGKVICFTNYVQSVQCDCLFEPGKLPKRCTKNCSPGHINVNEIHGYKVATYCKEHTSQQVGLTPPNGQTSAQLATNQQHFISAPSNEKFENIPLTHSSFRSKVAKLKNGKIRMKKKGTFHISAMAHHTSPTAADFNGNAELSHRLTINNVAVPMSTSHTVWASKPNELFRHKHHSHTRFTVYLKEGDDLAFEFSGSKQAGITSSNGGPSALISIEEVSSKKG